MKTNAIQEVISFMEEKGVTKKELDLYFVSLRTKFKLKIDDVDCNREIVFGTVEEGYLRAGYELKLMGSESPFDIYRCIFIKQEEGMSSYCSKGDYVKLKLDSCPLGLKRGDVLIYHSDRLR